MATTRMYRHVIKVMLRCTIGRLLVCVIVAMAIAGCRTTWYEIELHPDGDAMQRKVSMWLYTYPDGVQTYDDFSPLKLRRISSLYGAEMPTELAKRHEFEGEFRGRLPADISDGGWYLYQAVPMGSISAYIEHVGGARKISWDLETRELSLNRLVDVWLAWLDTEFASDARYPRFREFVDVVVRDDLWNISLYLWAFDTAGLVSSASAGDEEEEQLVEDFIFRAGIYLAERGYFDPEEIPELIRGFAVAEDEHLPEHFLTALMRGLATKLGTPTDEPLPWPLTEFVERTDAYTESFEKFVAESDTLRAMVKAWEQEYWGSLSPSEYAQRKKIDSRAEEILGASDPASVDVIEDLLEVDAPPINFPVLDDAESVISQLITKAFLTDMDFLGTDGSGLLQITLHMPQQPILTNGNWTDDSSVRWRENIAPGGEFGNRLPDVFYAFWATADVKFQEQRFGRVVLNDMKLVEHTGWYIALSPESQGEWDEFLTGLAPGPDLIPTLQGFCFSEELPACQAKPDPAAPGYMEVKGGGDRLHIPTRSAIAEEAVRGLIVALLPDSKPEPPDDQETTGIE